MTTNTSTQSDPMGRLAAACADMLNGMIEARLEYAAAHGFTATDEEIAESIKASLRRMMAAEVAK